MSGDPHLWHRRMGHVSKEQLKRVRAHEIIDGFNLVGVNNEVRGGCETCAMDKISAHSNAVSKKYHEAIKRIKKHSFSNIKSLPYESF